jgi:multisite-specific tRNA:(cytosine-C5)-methyltransferase
LYTAFELVDVSDKFPSLQRRPGLKTWIPSVDRTATTFFETWEDLMTSSLDDPTKARFLKSQWAPENIEDLHIDRWYVTVNSYLLSVAQTINPLLV